MNQQLHFGNEKQLKSVSRRRGWAVSVKRFDDDDDDDDDDEAGNQSVLIATTKGAQKKMHLGQKSS